MRRRLNYVWNRIIQADMNMVKKNPQNYIVDFLMPVNAGFIWQVLQ